MIVSWLEEWLYELWKVYLCQSQKSSFVDKIIPRQNEAGQNCVLYEAKVGCVCPDLVTLRNQIDPFVICS